MIRVRDRLVGVISADSGDPVDPPALVPADIAVELAGEAVRPRLCIVAMPQQLGDRALRPDLTLPLALGRIADLREGKPVADRVSYAGRAWRVPASGAGPVEFEQVGFEWFDLPRSAETDAAAIALTWQALSESGISGAQARLGDVSLFPDFVSALDMHPDWRAEILALAAQPKRLIARLASGGAADPLDPALAEIAALPDGEAETALEAYLTARGLDAVGHRPLGMVIDRLRQKASLARAGSLPDSVRTAIADCLAFEAALPDAAGALARMRREHGVTVPSAALELLEARHADIARLVPALRQGAMFAVRTGLSFTYYDGFVFDLFAQETSAGALASGGRYDGLLARLSLGYIQATAIGAVLRPERIEAALAGGAE